MSLIVEIKLSDYFSKIVCPKGLLPFKIKPHVASDETFKAHLKESMTQWKEVKDLGVSVLTWWEQMVKPGVLNLAIGRSKEINKERRSELNLLLLHQAHLSRKIQRGELQRLGELGTVQTLIEPLG